MCSRRQLKPPNKVEKHFFSSLFYEGLEISSVAVMQCKLHDLQMFFFVV